MQHQNNEKNSDFGFKKVTAKEKTLYVKAVFDSVAKKYDIMNDFMSFGLHRLWKRIAIEMASVKPDFLVLDLAGGTGDLTALMAKRLQTGRIILADINEAMLKVGRDRLIDQGFSQQIQIMQMDAECLPFADNSLDLITMAFGLRNVTCKENALQEMCRILKPGGNCLVVEFSRPTHPILQRIYDSYSFNVIPKLGEWIAEDKASYQYLVESIRKHPDQETLKNMMLSAGFSQCHYRNLSGGIVAIHQGTKAP